MTGFGPRNAYYLRISRNVVLPLFLYLDERHVHWMSDRVLQHVLADLRPLIIPKLQVEKDVHFGPGAAPGSKRGTVEVHRGETYQFAYFFRKTEPHTVLYKSRYFVTAPVAAREAPRSASPQLADQHYKNKRPRTRMPAKQSNRKRVKVTKAKDKVAQKRFDEDQWSSEESEDDTDDADLPRGPPPVRRQRRVVTTDAHQEDEYDNEEEDASEDITMSSPTLETDEGSSGDPGVLVTDDGDVVALDENEQASAPLGMTDIELAVEEEEEKLKPLLKLKYQSFPITGHCLCVVVEPWPPLRTEAMLQSESAGSGITVHRSVESSIPLSDGSVIAEQRAKTPLFFPEYDRAPSEAPFARERTLPPVPLFRDTVEIDDYNDDLMNFSQTLNVAGHMHAITADDDDDMDGAVLFGDADEVRELI